MGIRKKADKKTQPDPAAKPETTTAAAAGSPLGAAGGYFILFLLAGAALGFWWGHRTNLTKNQWVVSEAKRWYTTRDKGRTFQLGGMTVSTALRELDSAEIACGDRIFHYQAKPETTYTFENENYFNYESLGALSTPVLLVLNYVVDVKAVLQSVLPKMSSLPAKDPRVIIAGVLGGFLGVGIGYHVGHKVPFHCNESKGGEGLLNPVLWRGLSNAMMVHDEGKPSPSAP